MATNKSKGKSRRDSKSYLDSDRRPLSPLERLHKKAGKLHMLVYARAERRMLGVAGKNFGSMSAGR